MTTWTSVMQQAVTDPQVLLEHLGLTVAQFNLAVNPSFRMKVPWTYISRMKKKTPNDPLLLECLTQQVPTSPAFSQDPLAEQAASPVPGLIHKYAHRALVTVTSVCPIHCQYCFRQHFPYAKGVHSIRQQAIAYLKQNPSISEVILSGGDPLMLSDSHLLHWLNDIDSLAHIHTIRFHTRMPVIVPSRMTTTLLNALAKHRCHIVMVMHVNHANALDDQTAKTFHACRAAHIHLLNQSVLLQGINDDEASLVALSHRLFSQGVLPYYLHQLDTVQGAENFACPLSKGQALMAAIQKKLPGYLVPHFVVEEAGKPHKTRIG